MSGKCSHENCFSDLPCALGHMDRSDCKFWKETKENGENEAANIPQGPSSDVPWNGYALGTHDLTILGGRGRSFVFGLVGPPDSGKTSLLAFIYMWLLKYGKLGEWQFAGSWTLGGWESVVQYSRWVGEPPPAFPPHTSSTGRHPGILHIALRHSVSGALRDVMFTDAPGEWFTQWSRVPGNTAAAGARWVMEHSSILFLLVDSAALANTDKLPNTRRDTRDLIERVAAERKHLPIKVIWTKDDVEVPDLARESIVRTCSDFLPSVETAKTTTEKPNTIEQCFARALSTLERKAIGFQPTEPRASNDPFLAFRGIHVNT